MLTYTYLKKGKFGFAEKPKPTIQHDRDKELMKLAEEAGFCAAVIPAGEIPTDGSFRKLCEENLCGKYNANYSCPPGCGTVEEVHQRLFAAEKALVLQTIQEIGSYENKETILDIRKNLNIAVLNLAEQMRKSGTECFCLGYGGCHLCDPCKQAIGEPCVSPEKRVSCLSAYCIDAGKLAEKCGMEFAWVPEKLYLFGMIVIKK